LRDDGYTTRQATPEDHPLFVSFFLTFEMPDPTPDLAWWTRFCQNACFIEQDGAAVGYGLAYKLDAGGYVMHCATAESARRRGVGRAVMEALAERLRDEGCTRWSLNVKEENAAAIALYRRFGLEVAFKVAALATMMNRLISSSSPFRHRCRSASARSPPAPAPVHR